MFYSWKLNFVLFLSHFLVNISTDQCSNWQSCFNAVSSTSKQRRWTNVSSTFNVNQISTLKQQWFIDVESTPWINIILSTLLQRCFANVETTSINVRRLNFHFQLNINVEITLMNFDDQRCFNFDSTLMCLLDCSFVTLYRSLSPSQDDFATFLITSKWPWI